MSEPQTGESMSDAAVPSFNDISTNHIIKPEDPTNLDQQLFYHPFTKFLELNNDDTEDEQ